MFRTITGTETQLYHRYSYTSQKRFRLFVLINFIWLSNYVQLTVVVNTVA
jgi:hypothetical protein